MTYDISQEIKTIADNKRSFKFKSKNYTKEMSDIFEKYKAQEDLTKKTDLLCDIAIASILLVGEHIGFEKIENKISAVKIKDEVDELGSLERLVSIIPTFLISGFDTKANMKSLLRTLGGLVELNKKNFRQCLKDKIVALLA